MNIRFFHGGIKDLYNKGIAGLPYFKVEMLLLIKMTISFFFTAYSFE